MCGHSGNDVARLIRGRYRHSVTLPIKVLFYGYAPHAIGRQRLILI
tara:strand:+ start:519 stop:656 length:138 start_codon:yes stop_codon:yes gene_type:complete